MAKEQNKYAFDYSFYTASATYVATNNAALTVLKAKFLHDGFYRFVVDITDLDYTGSETYTLTVYTNSGSTTLCTLPILAADLFNPSTGNYRGQATITRWINVANITTDIRMGLTLANGSGTASITCEVGIVDGN
jgi:hypothetical protein